MAGYPSNLVNALDPTIHVDQSIYDGTNTTQKAPLGTRMRVGDKTFHYALASASVAGGTVLCATAPVASHQSGILAIAATSVDAQIISGTSSAAVAANFYAEGQFGQAAGAGQGESYRIKANAAGSTGFAITLYDRLNTAITSGTGYFLTQNLYKNVFVGSQGLGLPVGVAPTAVTSGAYFWLQTWGPANPTHVGNTPAAAVLHLGATGSVTTTFDATTNGGTAGVAFQIGKNGQLAATAGQANPVYLTICV